MKKLKLKSEWKFLLGLIGAFIFTYEILPILFKYIITPIFTWVCEYNMPVIG